MVAYVVLDVLPDPEADPERVAPTGPAAPSLLSSELVMGSTKFGPP